MNTPVDRRRLAVSVLCGVAVLAGAALTGSIGPGEPATQQTVLDVGAPGVVQALYLDDGAPVFVVHATDGQVQVLSAVDPSSQGLVVWCGDTRTFVEAGGMGRWDELGRYLFGAEFSGLAPYEVTSDPSRATVQVGARLPARPASDNPRAVAEDGSCYAGGGAGGLRHDTSRGHAQPVESVERAGRFVKVHATLHADPSSGTQLCAASAPPTACAADAGRVTGLFHPTESVEELRGVTVGDFLVRAHRDGTLGELIDLSSALDELAREPAPTRFSPSDVTAGVVDVTGDGDQFQLVMHEARRPRPIFPDDPVGPPPASRTWPIADDAVIFSFTTAGQYPYADFLTVPELAAMVDEVGRFPAELHLDGDGVVVSLRPVADEGVQ